jgi:hypothetical protein
MESFFVDKNWFYTAITRARNLDDVYFMMSDKQSEDAEYKLLRTYFIDKKEGYIQQDYKNGTITQPGQEFKSNYINIDWFFNNIKNIVEIVVVICLILLMEMLKVI